MNILLYFWTARLVQKLNARKYIRNNNNTGSFVRNLFNMKNYRTKYFRHKVFVIYGTLYVNEVYSYLWNASLVLIEIWTVSP